MASLKDRNGTVVSVADDRVDRFLANGFTPVGEKPKAPAKKATRATKAAKKAS